MCEHEVDQSVGAIFLIAPESHPIVLCKDQPKRNHYYFTNDHTFVLNFKHLKNTFYKILK